jgi:FAD-linked sulfhydryl oxidase
MSSISAGTEDKRDEGKVLPGGKKIINGIVYDADGKP